MSLRNKIQVEIAQQPDRARMCGFTVADRRAIQPPPILQIRMTEEVDFSIAGRLVAAVTLVSSNSQSNISDHQVSMASNETSTSNNETNTQQDDARTDRLSVESDLISPTSTVSDATFSTGLHRIAAGQQCLTSQVLQGNLVLPCSILMDPQERRGLYFVFYDLAVRSSGVFRLKFDVYDISRAKEDHLPIGSIVSQPITVYSPKTYPGVLPATELSRCFYDQGVPIRFRSHGS